MYYDSDDNDFKDFYDDDYDDNYKPESKNKMVQLLKKEGQEMQYLSEIPFPYGRYVAIDAEFTGLDEKEDQLLELAACEIYNCELTNNRFHAYIKPRGEIKGTEFHGITKDAYEKLSSESLDDKKNLEKFLEFVGDSLIVAHNPIKDIAFINKELALNGLKEIDKMKFRCTMRMFYKKYEHTYIKKINLEACCEIFHIFIVNKHKALDDSENTGKLLIRLMKKKNKNKKKKKKKNK